MWAAKRFERSARWRITGHLVKLDHHVAVAA
jgi:hypothetical protein